MFRRINKEFELVFRVRAFWKHEGRQWMVSCVKNGKIVITSKHYYNYDYDNQI